MSETRTLDLDPRLSMEVVEAFRVLAKALTEEGRSLPFRMLAIADECDKFGLSDAEARSAIDVVEHFGGLS